MKIDNCEFPDDVLYQLENMVWLSAEGAGIVRVGITSVHSALVGRLTQIKLKSVTTKLRRGQLLATMESPRHFGSVRSPVTGTVIEVNEALDRRPKLANDSPYSEGWFARIQLTDKSELGLLSYAKDIESAIRSQIKELRVRCFSAYPDHEMWEIGVECAAVLVRLNELMERIPVGDIVHVVSDDLTADIEMERWSDETGQLVLESRREGRMFHFIVKKVR